MDGMDRFFDAVFESWHGSLSPVRRAEVDLLTAQLAHSCMSAMFMICWIGTFIWSAMYVAMIVMIVCTLISRIEVHKSQQAVDYAVVREVLQS